MKIFQEMRSRDPSKTGRLTGSEFNLTKNSNYEKWSFTV
jgi:hypothetical protein